MLAAGGAIDPFWAMYAQHQTAEVRTILETYRIGDLVSSCASCHAWPVQTIMECADGTTAWCVHTACHRQCDGVQYALVLKRDKCSSLSSKCCLASEAPPFLPCISSLG